jgi:hypothetical protein
MGERHAERATSAKNAVDLSKYAVEVLCTGEGVHRQRHIDLVGSYEGKIGEVTVVEFDFDLVHFGELTGGIDPADVIVDSDHMGPSEGQTHGVMAKSDA